MPTILITRPKVMSETLASTLQGLGYATAIEPLLTIELLATPRPEEGVIDAVMITSGNALLAMQGRKDDVAVIFDTPCFCVGPRTAEAARVFGFRRAQNSAGDGAELAGFMNTAFGGKAATILHIAGRDTERVTRLELEKHGHRVIGWTVYDAKPATMLTPVTRDLLMQQKLDAVLVFSPKTASVLSGLMTGAALEACCARLAAICLSNAVADDLRSLPWRRVLAPPRPAEDAVIACLQETCPVKS
jgi:uroporphyrinogen-III synthase